MVSSLHFPVGRRGWCAALALVVLLTLPLLTRAQVGVGTTTPNPKAALDISATDKGLLIPRLTQAQRVAIVAPPDGLMVFQTDGTAGFWYWFGGAWVNIPTTATAADNLGNHTATQALNLQGNALTGTGASISGIGLGVRADGGLNLGQNAPGGNVLVGYQAGRDNTSGTDNQFVGVLSGARNQTGSLNYFSGYQSGFSSVAGSGNVFVGAGAGYFNFLGDHNTALGFMADVGGGNLRNATAIGYNARVNQSSSLVLGGTGADSVRVGIGTPAPAATLHVAGRASTLRVDGLAGTGPGRLVTLADDGTLRTQGPLFGTTVASPQAAAVVGAVFTGTRPTGVAVHPAGYRAYVTNAGSTPDPKANTLETFDLTGPLPVSRGTTAVNGPQGVAVNAAGTRAYVINSTQLHTFDLTGPLPVRLSTVPTASGVSRLVLNPAGTRAYVMASSSLTCFDLTGAQPVNLSVATTGGGANGVALNPAGTRAYVAATSTLQTYDLTGPALVRVGSVAAGPQAFDVVVNSAGTTAYVTNYGGNTIGQFDLTAGPLPVSRGTAPTGSQPLRLALNPAGTLAVVVTYGGNTAETFDLTGALPVRLGTVPTGTQPLDVATNPAGTRAYLVNDLSGTLQTLAVGTAPRLLAQGSDGTLGSVDAGTLGDNLGNHTATTDLDLGTNHLVGNGGTSGLAVSNAGRVGVGTTAPAAMLDVQGGADGNGANDPVALAFGWHGGGYRHFLRSRHSPGASGGNALDFYLNTATTAAGSTAPGVGSLPVLTLENTNGARVGIGTTAPAAALDIQAAPRTGSHTFDGQVLYATGDVGEADKGFEFVHSNGTQGIGLGFNTFYAAGSNPDQHLNLLPKGTGNVGVGTTAPGQLLQLGSTTLARPAFLRLGTGTGNNNPGRLWDMGVAMSTAAPNDVSGENFDFALRDASANATRLLVEWDTGNVGIGTAAPVARLDVAGNARIDGNLEVTGKVKMLTIRIGMGANGNGAASFTWTHNLGYQPILIGSLEDQSGTGGAAKTTSWCYRHINNNSVRFYFYNAGPDVVVGALHLIQVN